MKKKIFSLVAIAAISLGAWNYSENQNNVELSDLALANVEALASGEGEHMFGRWDTEYHFCALLGDGTGCYLGI